MDDAGLGRYWRELSYYDARFRSGLAEGPWKIFQYFGLLQVLKHSKNSEFESIASVKTLKIFQYFSPLQVLKYIKKFSVLLSIISVKIFKKN